MTEQDVSWFYPEGNLVLFQDRTVASDGTVVVHATTLWAEAVDREHARYIANALNKVGFREVNDGSK